MKKIVLLIVFILGCFNSNAQLLSDYKNLPLEKLYVHQNTSLLFSGEYLFYKIYSLEALTNKPSKASKIAYVLIVGEGNRVISKQKIELDQGLGQGDFFIPTSVKSGTYKLIAYTKWMLNNSSSKFYESELYIINPYLGDQGKIVENKKHTKNSIAISDTIIINHDNDNFYNNRKFEIITNREEYTKREKVEVQLLNTKGQYGYGNFSVSVRQIENYNPVKKFGAREYYKTNFNKTIIKSIGVESQMPEINGELISGHVSIKNSNKIASDVLVTISIPGEELFLKVVKTDKNGNFNVFLNDNFDGNNAFIQVVNNDVENYLVSIDKAKSINFNELIFSPFNLSANTKDLIIKRSVNNQIENNYFKVKPDSIVSVAKKSVFYNNKSSITIVLEDYKKFPTLNDVFIEVVDPIFKERIDGKIIFHIKHRYDNFDENLIPLILLDGIMVQDYEAFLEFDANLVEKVIIFKDRVYFGTETYAGVIAVETFDNIFETTFNSNQITKIDLLKPEQKKQYFKQEYNDISNLNSSRIPDYRTQLLWLPQLTLDSSRCFFSFYTSDMEGTYEVTLEGFTRIGEAISLKKIIEVRN